MQVLDSVNFYATRTNPSNHKLVGCIRTNIKVNIKEVKLVGT